MAFFLKKLGPATMVAAAFIGPGTIISCSIAGASFGYTLIWAVVFSAISTAILQEMTGRLGAIKGEGLSGAIRTSLSNPALRITISILSLLAIVIGNAAYQSGNITGAMLGVSGIVFEPELGNSVKIVIILLMGLLVSLLLFLGQYKVIEKSLIVLVSVMSIIFFITAVSLPHDMGMLMKGIFIPVVPDDSLMLIIALIGTTVVPYNLFLHSSAVAEKWKGPEHIGAVRLDVFISVGIGGIISMFIVMTSAATLYAQGASVNGLQDLALQLTPVLGSEAGSIFSLGIFAAGLTSMITAPVAAAYTVTGLLGKDSSFQSTTFRLSWMVVLWTGVVVACLNIQPLLLIQVAQFANGLVLPFFGIFLLIIMNQRQLGTYKNGFLSNVMGAVVVLVVTVLGVRSILKAFDVI